MTMRMQPMRVLKAQCPLCYRWFRGLWAHMEKCQGKRGGSDGR